MINNTSSAGQSEESREWRALVEIFNEHRGNLSDKWEQYLAIYDMVLSPKVAIGRPLRLLEIGVQNGGSLQVWSKYLPPGSSIVGIDIDPACANLALGGTIQIHIGDASSEDVLSRLLGDATFDIIVDDGSHRSDHIISTFKACFRRLNLGGAYIIEDLHASYLNDLGGGFLRADAAIEWLKMLADAVNVDYLNQEEIDLLTRTIGMDAQALGSEVARVTFYDSVVAVEKAPKPKVAAFRRVMGGTLADVSDFERQIRQLPSAQLQSLILNPAALEAFGSSILAQLANAHERLGVAEHQRASLERTLSELKTHILVTTEYEGSTPGSLLEAFERVKAQGVLYQQQSKLYQQESVQHQQEAMLIQQRALDAQELVNTMRQNSTADKVEAQAAINRAYATAEQAQAELRSVLSSTTWQATRGLRVAGSRLPVSVRTMIRRAAKLVWWTSTGQLRAKMRARSTDTLPHNSFVRQPIVSAGTAPLAVEDLYSKWCRKHAISLAALALQRRMSAGFRLKPTFSVLVPVFNTPVDVFDAMVRSTVEQSYERWQLCLAIVDTGSVASELIEAAETFASKDNRIRVRILPKNLGISGNSNEAFAFSDGDWIVLLDHDDELSRDALFEIARAVNANPNASFIYSDKDMLSRDGTRRFNPLFKPAWSPETLLNANYLTHVCAMRADRVRQIGGWDKTTDGAQDWDLFLRVIGSSEDVVHIPKVLYHWRVIETSVSFGGLDAKPYATEGQLNTLRKHLPQAGWPQAAPKFEHGQLRIVWGHAPTSLSTLIIVCGGRVSEDHREQGRALNATVAHASGDDVYGQIDKLITLGKQSVIVLLDGDFQTLDSLSVYELAAPLVNPAIAIAAGRVLDANDLLLEFGMLFRNGKAYAAFRGQPAHYFVPGGSVGWYRNASAAPGGAVAFRRSDWQKVGGFEAFSREGRPDVAFSLAVVSRTKGRLLLNPFATFKTGAGLSIFERYAKGPISPEFIRRELPLGDPFLNPALDIELVPGVPNLPNISGTQAITPGHDFAAEARHVAATYAATNNQIRESILACREEPPGPLLRMAWFIPGFTVPFYGGIYTILRAADYMFRVHGVKAIFVVLGEDLPEEIAARIRLAFPDLADAASVFSMKHPGDQLPDLGEIDAAASTLWTTAFPLLRLRQVRRKIYFVQDWEPLFYPAGTVSATVEASYRFGFHAVCNTPSLAISYRELGGSADYFLPAVDSAVFHADGRPARPLDSPFVLVCYARPGTPRNCFESLCESLKMLKKHYGNAIEIVTAGQAWDEAAYGLEGIINNLGLLSYEETGSLYRAADAGLVAMATRHPSYLPFELMACGAAVVTNRNPTTAWLLRDGENCLLCEMTAGDVFESVKRLVDDPQLSQSITATALREISLSHNDWGTTCERIYGAISSVCEAT